MKQLLSIGVLLLCIGLWPLQAAAGHHHHDSKPILKKWESSGEKSKLQTLIDETEAGGTVQLEGRAYRGSILINKPITIIGVEGTKISSLATTLTISDTNDVVLKNVRIQGDELALAVNNVKGLTLEQVTFSDSLAAMQIMKSENILIKSVTVLGKDGHFSEKGHAVAIYDSNNFSAQDCNIREMQDGFYIENVDNVKLTNNRVSKGRYAVHMMYSNNIELNKNELTNNMTGFMIMVAKHVQIADNKIIKNNTLNSLGVYVYDIDHLQFEHNMLQENTTAMDIENAREMNIEHNVFSMNGTVLEVQRSSKLLVQHNEFVGNILTARTDNQGMLLQQNEYDDYDGKDYDGDGLGDTNYIATSSFGQWMVRKPVYQYFMESPSVVTLNMMDTEVTANNELVIVDKEPVVNKQGLDLNFKLNVGQFALSGAVLVALLFVRRRYM